MDKIDVILLMSVNPGFGGQSFIPNSLKKIAAVSEMVKSRNLKTIIQVDGGVKVDNIGSIANAGANAFVVGSAIFGSDDYTKVIHDLRIQAM